MYVVTFYSFKGGVGRTLALLNVAWELADSDLGKKVLVVDFDLEAPGIRADRWYRAQADADAEFRSDGDRNHRGIVEYVARYLNNDLRVPDVTDYIVDVTPGKCQGRLALMPAGVDDETYGARLGRIDWNDLYQSHDGYVMFEDTRAQWADLGFDYVLLDSRTGYTDVGGICTRHLPDAVVTLFRPEGQSLAGMKEIVEAVRAEEPNHRRQNEIELHFVMTGIPDADDDEGILEARKKIYAQELGIPKGREMEIRQYQNMDLLTQPVYTQDRPRARLAGRYRELAKRIRQFNIEDRNGVLMQLRKMRVMQGNYLSEVEERYAEDAGVLCQLAYAYGVRGQFHAEARHFSRAADLGPLSRTNRWRLAQARHRTGDRDGVLEALHGFFRESPATVSEESDDNEIPLSVLVSRALGLLEALDEDRARYIADSLALQNMPVPILARIAELLDRSRPERQVAARILKDILDRDAAGDEYRDSWKWQLAFASMAIGSWDEALRLFGNALATTPPSDASYLLTAFNTAMANWAVLGTPNRDEFRRVIECTCAKDDAGHLPDKANRLQSLSVAEWLAGREVKAHARLDAAEAAVQHRFDEMSCWSYTRVNNATFLAHCTQIRRLFSGEDVVPEFMQAVEPTDRSPRLG